MCGQVCEDDSFLGAVDLAPRKAKTALLFGRPNQELQQAQLDTLYKVHTTIPTIIARAGLFESRAVVPEGSIWTRVQDCRCCKYGAHSSPNLRLFVHPHNAG